MPSKEYILKSLLLIIYFSNIYNLIPSYFIQIEKIPLLPNEKIAKMALAKQVEKINTGVKYKVLRNEVKKKLVESTQLC